MPYTNGDLQGSLDKERVVADPTHPGVAYVTWDHYTPTSNHDFHVPARFSRTTDGGLTWSAPLTIAGFPADEQAAIDTPLVDPLTGAVYVFFIRSTTENPDDERLAFVKSTDQGPAFLPTIAVSSAGLVASGSAPATGPPSGTTVAPQVIGPRPPAPIR